MTEPLQLTMKLSAGQRVRVRCVVEEDAIIPAPLEADVRREPTVSEWVEISRRLGEMDFEVEGGER